MGAVIARVCGGLGNQLFIFAAAQACALKAGRRLLLDTRTGFERDVYRRKYLLHEYAIDAGVASYQQSYGGFWGRLRRIIARQISARRPWGRGPIVSERGPYFCPRLLQLPSGTRDLYLEGYWQSPLYFNEIRDDIAKQLTPLEKDWGPYGGLFSEIGRHEAVCLHVRSFKEVDGRVRPSDLSLYYNEAITRVRSMVKSPRFYVFSDDLGFAKSIISPGDAFHFVECCQSGATLSVVKELELMRCCKHFVITNSTFGWWAAWLGSSARKIVFISTRRYPATNVDIFPAGWLDI